MTCNSIFNAEQTVPLAPPAVASGLHSIALSTAKMADYSRTNPSELRRITEMGDRVIEQYRDLIGAAKKSVDDGKELLSAAEEAKKTAGWIGTNLCGENTVSIPVNNSFGRVVNSFEALW